MQDRQASSPFWRGGQNQHSQKWFCSASEASGPCRASCWFAVCSPRVLPQTSPLVSGQGSFYRGSIMWDVFYVNYLQSTNSPVNKVTSSGGNRDGIQSQLCPCKNYFLSRKPYYFAHLQRILFQNGSYFLGKILGKAIQYPQSQFS